MVSVHSAICETFFGLAVFHTFYAQLEKGISALSIFAFCCILNLFDVVVFHRSLVNWRGVQVPYVYVHSAVCYTDFV